jgi:hypothetical protein
MAHYTKKDLKEIALAFAITLIGGLIILWGKQ